MHDMITRRTFAGISAGAIAATLPHFARGGSGGRELRRETHTYKTAGSLEIQLDLIRADDAVIRPVSVWIHGGALINGHRESVHGRMQTMMLAEGHAIVSIDYRLAPETKLPAIIADVEDAFRWLRRFGEGKLGIDPSRMSVWGGSAGGYLTLVTGYRVEPRPSVLVSLWGYGDLIGDWYSKPSPHPRHQQPKLSREEALAQVSGPPVSDSRQRNGNGGAFYQHCRQHGIWPREVSGWDPATESAKFDPYMPVKNVTDQWPPTLMIHGTRDTDVPFEQSSMMAEQFKRRGVLHELIEIAGGEHGLGGGDAQQIDAAYEKARRFVVQHTAAGR